MRIEVLPFRWSPINPDVERKLDYVLKRWLETPYVLGQCARGRAVDCVHFVAAVYQELDGIPRPEIQKLSGDRCLHDPRGTQKALRAFLRSFGPYERIRDGSLEPGDALVTGPKHGGPGHALIAGAKKNTIYHCTQSAGVVQTGLGYFPDIEQLYKVYRPTYKYSWLWKD